MAGIQYVVFFLLVLVCLNFDQSAGDQLRDAFLQELMAESKFNPRNFASHPIVGGRGGRNRPRINTMPPPLNYNDEQYDEINHGRFG